MAKVDSYGASDVGLRRQLNEDSLVIDKDSRIFIVADGMGGHNAGEIASSLAADTVKNFVLRSVNEEEITWPYGVDPKMSVNANRLRTAFLLANKRVWKEADNREDYTGMGTTMVAAIVDDAHITFASAGDSRVYRIRNGEIEQMTIDDSWIQVAINEGVLDPDEAETHPMRNIITKAIGAKETIDLIVQEEELEADDLYLLCSDGLHGMISDDEILKILSESEGGLEDYVDNLIKAANDNGGKDNVTALAVRLSAEEPTQE